MEPHVRVVGADVALNMVRLGKDKVAGRQPPVALIIPSDGLAGSQSAEPGKHPTCGR